MTDLLSRRQLLFFALFGGTALADAPAPKVNEKGSRAAASGAVFRQSTA
jgi:hypothetical protein